MTAPDASFAEAALWLRQQQGIPQTAVEQALCLLGPAMRAVDVPGTDMRCFAFSTAVAARVHQHEVAARPDFQVDPAGLVQRTGPQLVQAVSAHMQHVLAKVQQKLDDLQVCARVSAGLRVC